MEELRAGLHARVEHDVTAQDTAIALGSGDIDVLATPRLLAWCEAATVAALAPAVPPERTSVGTRIEIEHLLPTPVGGHVLAEAVVVHADGRSVRCHVRAEDAQGRLVATGTVTRVVVDRDRFAGRVPPA